MANPTPQLSTLQHLIDALKAAPDRTDVQKRDEVSAVRTVAKALGAEPSVIALNVKLLRQRMEEVSPAAIGLSQSRWNNVRSLFSRALQLAVAVKRSPVGVPISPSWQALRNKLPRSGAMRVGALCRSLSARGIEPADVTLADLEVFRDEIINDRLRSGPEKTWDGIVWTWNKAAASVPQWPQVIIPREDRRKVYVRPWSDFPVSLKADVDAYMKLLSGDLVDEDAPVRALRPITIRNREYQARVAASALVAEGVPIESLTSLHEIARLDRIKIILNHVRSRGGTVHTAHAFNMANFLKAAARHWVKIDGQELEKIRKIASQLSPKQKGLTRKNRKRLLPFNDPDVISRFLDIPDQLATEVRADGRKTIVTAVSAQIAVAIAILQVAPIRIQNLASLDLNENFSSQGGRLFLRFDGTAMKNGRDFLAELPDHVADLIAWYCREYRPLLLRGPTNALFPGEGGGAKLPNTLGRQIDDRVKAYLGFPVNPHMFRHIAAKLYLDQRPGEYGLVSRLLNHKSIATTMSAYTGAETISAVRHYQEVVARGRHVQPKPQPQRKSQSSSKRTGT
jgi:integrase